MPVPHEFLVKWQDVTGGERHGSRIGGFLVSDFDGLHDQCTLMAETTGGSSVKIFLIRDSKRPDGLASS